MTALRRLYRYLRNYKAWAFVAFGSMVVFAGTQTVLMMLVTPLFDEVLSPPKARAAAAASPVQPTDAKQTVLNALLNRDRPEGQRGALVNTYDSALRRWNAWWNGNPADKPQRV